MKPKIPGLQGISNIWRILLPRNQRTVVIEIIIKSWSRTIKFVAVTLNFEGCSTCVLWLYAPYGVKTSSLHGLWSTTQMSLSYDYFLSILFLNNNIPDGVQIIIWNPTRWLPFVFLPIVSRIWICRFRYPSTWTSSKSSETDFTLA